MKDTAASSRSGILFILLAAVLWGTTGTSQALSPRGVNPQTLGALRLALGGLVLLVPAMFRTGWGVLRGWHPLPVVVGGGCIALYQLTFFAGVGRTGVAVGTMVAIGSSPIVAGILDMWVRRESVDRRWVISTLLAVCGCVLLLQGGDLTVDVVGVMLALCAGASYSVYTLAIKSLLAERAADEVMAVAFCVGALLLSPFLVTSDLAWAAQPRGIVVVLHLGIVATAVAYRVFARGLKTVPVSTAVTLSLAEPMTATVLGVVVVGERMTVALASGILLIFMGLSLLALPVRHRR